MKNSKTRNKSSAKATTTTRSQKLKAQIATQEKRKRGDASIAEIFKAAVLEQPLPDKPKPKHCPMAKHEARLATINKRVEITADVWQRILERTRAGQTPATVAVDADMPTYSAMVRYAMRDETTLAEWQGALATMSDSMIKDAQEFARDMAASGSTDDMRIADMYLKSISLGAEKIAPRTHGPLIKVAGSDGGALQVSVINYAADNAQRNSNSGEPGASVA